MPFSERLYGLNRFAKIALWMLSYTGSCLIYSLLAEGRFNLIPFLVTFWIAPTAVAIVWFVATDELIRRWTPFLILFFCTPIFISGLAALLRLAGLNLAADLVFSTRYLWLFAPPIAALIYTGREFFRNLTESQ